MGYDLLVSQTGILWKGLTNLHTSINWIHFHFTVRGFFLICRVFWCIAFLISVAVAVILIVEIWEKYRVTPVITVFQHKETRINLMPFPGVTICNTNNVLKSMAEEHEKLVKTFACNCIFT